MNGAGWQRTRRGRRRWRRRRRRRRPERQALAGGGSVGGDSGGVRAPAPAPPPGGRRRPEAVPPTRQRDGGGGSSSGHRRSVHARRGRRCRRAASCGRRRVARRGVPLPRRASATATRSAAFHRRCHGGGGATAGGFALLTHTVRHTRPLRGRRRKEFSLQGALRGGVRRDTGKGRHWYGSGDRRGGRSTPPRWRDGVATIPPFPPALLRRPTPRIPAPPARPIPPSPSASQQPCQTPAAADTACSRESGARRSQRRWDGTARGVWACGEVALPMAHALGHKVDGSTGGRSTAGSAPAVGGGVRVGRSLQAA